MPAGKNSVSLPELLDSIDERAWREATLVSELAGGPVSRSWQLDTVVGPVVLRMDLPLAAKLALERSAEMLVLKAAARNDIGPELLWADPEQGLQITRLLPGRIWTEDDVAKPANLIRLGALFSRLHSIPVVHESQDLRKTLEIYATSINTSRAQSLFIAAEKILVDLNVDSGVPVFCHRDAHCGNIIDNGELRLIDWEYAGSGDPCFDLAVVAQQHQLTVLQLDLMLESYDDRPYSVDKGRLQHFCRLYGYIAILWDMFVSQAPPQARWKPDI